MSKSEVKKPVLMVGRIVLAAAILTPVVIGVASLVEVLLGVEVGAGAATTAVPIMIAIATAMSGAKGKRNSPTVE
ncbi:MAG TPA: hypothetical protein VJB57_03525 [Dehalococcoidia bacterium]|nr:hypothetical protein [Dehalococcoidia bacterium]